MTENEQRDFLALEAMRILIPIVIQRQTGRQSESIAQQSYEIADKMIEEKKKKESKY